MSLPQFPHHSSVLWVQVLQDVKNLISIASFLFLLLVPSSSLSGTSHKCLSGLLFNLPVWDKESESESFFTLLPQKCLELEPELMVEVMSFIRPTRY